MIMPADAQVGDVYRAENMPGVVSEQVTVKAIGKTVAGRPARSKGRWSARSCTWRETSRTRRLHRLALASAQARDVDAQLRYLEAAAEAGEFEAIERAAARLRETIRNLEPTA